MSAHVSEQVSHVSPVSRQVSEQMSHVSQVNEQVSEQVSPVSEKCLQNNPVAVSQNRY